MKNLKKVLALVVVFAMMLGTVAFAAFPDVAVDADYANAVNTLAALDIIGGDDQGNFNPDNTITRAEVTKIICEMQGLKGDASKGATIFTDVAADHWASGYINMATNMGIVNGMGDGTFAPDAPVTYEQVVKMIVVALGYAPMAADKGGYPTGHLVVAQSAGVTKNVAAPAQTDAAKRALVSQLVYNALDVPMMEKTGFGTNESFEIMDGTGDKARNTLLTTKFDVIKLGGVVIANEKVALEDVVLGDDTNDGSSVEGEITLAYDNNYKTTNEDFELGRNESAAINAKVGDTNAADLFGQRVIAYIQDTGRAYEVIAIVAEDGKNNSVAFNLDDVDTGDRTITDAEVDADDDDDITALKLAYYETENAKKSTQLKVADTYRVVWNSLNSSADLDDIVDAADDAEFSAKIELIDWDADDKFDLIKVDQYAHYVVDEIEAEDFLISTLDGSEIDLDAEANEDAVITIKDVNGDAIAFEDIAVGDVLAVISDDVDDAYDYETFIDITVLGQTAVEGVVKSVDNATDKVTIDGTKYAKDAACYNGNKIAIGSEGTYYLGIAGQIVAFDGSKATAGNYAIILETAENETGFDQGIQVKVLNNKGEAIIYNVGKKIKIKNAEGMATSYDATAEDLELDLDDTAWAAYADETSIADLFANFEEEPTTYAEVLERLVQIKVNSSNEITEIAAAADDTFVVDYQYEENEDEELVVVYNDKEYNATTGKFTGIGKVDESTLIFNINWNDITKSKIITADALLDDAEYKVVGIDKEDGVYGAMIVLDGGNTLAGSIDGMAVVTAVSETRDANDDDAYDISFVVNGEKEEKTIKVTADTEVDATFNGDADAMDLAADMAVGSLFLYAADAEGNALTIASIANVAVNADGDEIYVFVIDEDDTYGSGSNETTFVYGYADGAKLENPIDLSDGQEITVEAGTYKYTYNNVNTRSKRIEVGSYKGGDVAKLKDGAASLFVARVVDDEVVDVISIGARVTASSWDDMPVVEDEEEEDEEV